MTTTVNLNEFGRTVRTEVKGCPRSVVENAIRESVRYFCTETQAWREELPSLAMVAGQAEYPLTPPTDTDITALREVRQAGLPVGAARAVDFARVANWKTDTADTLRFYIVVSPKAIRFIPVPQTVGADAVDITAAVRPSRTAATCADFLLDSHESCIASGAIAKLLLMRDRQWSDPNDAAVHLKFFNDGVAMARRESDRGLSAAPMIAHVPYFA